MRPQVYFLERQPIAMLEIILLFLRRPMLPMKLIHSFTIAVTNTNDAPTLANAISDQTVAEDSALSFQFASDVFADVDAGDSFTYTATLSDDSALPSWLSFDAGTRTFSGTPLNEHVGTIALKVTATE